MATIQGTDGEVTLPAGFCMKVTAWSGRIMNKKKNTTGFGDKGWKTGKLITGRMVGELIGVIQDDGMMPDEFFDQDGDNGQICGVAHMKSTMKLYVTQTPERSFSGTFLITPVSLIRAEEGQDTSVYRLAFASTGQVTQTWS
jgi:hypothetical protein